MIYFNSTFKVGRALFSFLSASTVISIFSALSKTVFFSSNTVIPFSLDISSSIGLKASKTSFRDLAIKVSIESSFSCLTML